MVSLLSGAKCGQKRSLYEIQTSLRPSASLAVQAVTPTLDEIPVRAASRATVGGIGHIAREIEK